MEVVSGMILPLFYLITYKLIIMSTRIKNKIAIRVLSPDGFDILLDGGFPTFTTMEAARDGAKRWAETYRPQGFYSAIRDGVRLRIPIEEIIDHCYFVDNKGNHIE